MASLPLQRRDRRLAAVAVPIPAAGKPVARKRLLTDAGKAAGGGWRGHICSLLALAPGAIWLLVVSVFDMTSDLSLSPS